MAVEGGLSLATGYLRLSERTRVMGRTQLRVVSGRGQAGSALITRLALTEGRGPGKYQCAFGAAGTSGPKRPARPTRRRKIMSLIDEALSANATIANDYDPSRGSRRRPRSRSSPVRIPG